mgnify:CR=1 FL=1
MTKPKSLSQGIGNNNQVKRFYDEWSINYDRNLKNWGYTAPTKSAIILQKHLLYHPVKILDMACGTGLFAEKIIKIYPNALIDGIDISKEILKKAKLKKIYNKLFFSNFDEKIPIRIKYNLIACIGAMTYTKNPRKLILKVHDLTKPKGFFIFSHRDDLWKKQNYQKLLASLSNKWKIKFISKPILYLPKNREFTDKIKIKIALLEKN